VAAVRGTPGARVGARLGETRSAPPAVWCTQLSARRVALFLKVPARKLTVILLANGEGLWRQDPLHSAAVGRSGPSIRVARRLRQGPVPLVPALRAGVDPEGDQELEGLTPGPLEPVHSSDAHAEGRLRLA